MTRTRRRPPEAGPPDRAIRALAWTSADNAARFGALSVPEGKVAIGWTREEPGEGEQLVLEWNEQFGPPVKARRKKGFGSTAIERQLAHALDAEVSLNFDRKGLRCRIAIPAAHLLSRP